MPDVGVARLMVVHFVVPEMASTILVQSPIRGRCKVQRPPMPSKATEDLADFESRLAPNARERERGRGPKLLPTFFMSRGGRFLDIYELSLLLRER